MSDEQKPMTLRVAGYEPPRVTKEALDSGGNYVDPSWPTASLADGAAAAQGSGNIGTLGSSKVE